MTSSSSCSRPSSLATTKSSPSPTSCTCGGNTTTIIMTATTPEEIVLSSSSSSSSSSSLPCCFPHCCGKPVFHGNPEALAWGLDQMGRAIAYIGVAVFLGTALLKLATQAAGCPVDDLSLNKGENVPECHNRVYGVRPSSLLTTYAAIVSVASSFSMPLMGAMIDFTNHRRLMGRILTAAYVILLFPTIFVNSRTWFAITLIQFVGVFIGWGQAAVAYAYLPDLTTDEAILTEYTRSFTVLIFGSVVVYLAITVGLAMAFGFQDDNIAMAQFGMIIAFVLSIVTELWSWWGLFEKRPAARSLPSGKSLWTAGFEQVYSTSISICTQYSSLMWFFLSHSMSESAIMSLSSIAVTFFTEQLRMTATQNGIAAFVILISSIPGAFLSEWFTKKFNPIRSSIVALVILIVTTVVVAFVLNRPQLYVATFFLSACWGVGIGWKLTADEVVAASIIPEGQDAEIMGFYLFSGEVFGWLPPLLFTVLNEAGIPQQYGVGCLAIFWILAIIGLLLFGNYDQARERANRVKSLTVSRENSSGDIEVTKMIARVENGGNVDDDINDVDGDVISINRKAMDREVSTTIPPIANDDDLAEEATKMLSPVNSFDRQHVNGCTGGFRIDDDDDDDDPDALPVASSTIS